jgi:RNA polymerase sigma-70 factor (ECF subfamily)
LNRKEDCGTFREQNPELQRALEGDQDALGRLLASYMPKLYRTGLRILGTPQDAEEAIQDGFVQVVQHLGKFEGRSLFSSWVTRIVINAALMRLRQGRRHTTTSIDHSLTENGPLLADTIADPYPNPEEIYEREEKLQMLRLKVRGMPAAYRSALWLRLVEGLSTREAAEALGIPVGSVKTQLYRGRTRLSREFEQILSPALSQQGMMPTPKSCPEFVEETQPPWVGVM